jgi:hypothetical protein
MNIVPLTIPGRVPVRHAASLNAKAQSRKGAKTEKPLCDFAVLFRRIAHFWQNFSSARSAPLRDALDKGIWLRLCRAASLRPCVKIPVLIRGIREIHGAIPSVAAGRVALHSGSVTPFREDLLRIDAGPHPGPLPSDGRGNGYCPPSVEGALSNQCSRRFFTQTADGSPSPLSAVGPAKADGGEGRGEVEPLLRRPPLRCPSPLRLRLAALGFLRLFEEDQHRCLSMNNLHLKIEPHPFRPIRPNQA